MFKYLIPLLLGSTIYVDSYNFLVFCPLFGHSHTTFFAKIADTLTEAGHNVTFFTPTMIRKYENVTYVKSTKHVVKLSAPDELDVSDILDSGDVLNFWTSDPSALGMLPRIKKFKEMHNLQHERMFEKIEVLDEMKRTYKYDAIIYETLVNQAYPLMEYMNIKTQIPAISMTIDVDMARAIGEPVMPSAVVDMRSSFGDQMTLSQRVINSIATPMMLFLLGIPEFLSFTKPRKPADIQALRPKSSFFLVNSNPYLDFPRPTITKTVQIGGISINMDEMKKEKVDKEMDEILSRRSMNMLISFGSIQQSQFMPDSYKTAIIEAFSEFPEVTFIWKYESDNHSEISRNLPNVHFMKWVPQRALLVDQRLTAFFTHAGLGSVNELSYSGKPAILCPVFADQMRNTKMMVRHEGAIEYSRFDLDNPLKLEEAIRSILYDSKYAENARNLARRLEKQPIKPADLLVKHCEFAAEFGELPSLDPYSRQMSFISYFMIDIALILLGIFLGLTFIIYYIVKSVFIRVWSRKTVKTD